MRDAATRAAAPAKGRDAASKSAARPVEKAASPSAAKPRKLSFKEQRELDELPARIEALEAEQKTIGAFLARPESYTEEADRAARAQQRHAQIDAELTTALERWEVLGSR